MREVGRLNVCGIRYRVFMVADDEVPELVDGEEGACVPSKARIYLRASMPRELYRDTLVHEIGHAWLLASGLVEFLKGRVHGDIDAFEETLIRLAVPSLLQLLDANQTELAELLGDGKRKK